ncbi:hypothetical protein M3610_00620 [Neobacillus sp. MER 74]|uniref:hypothetical protein n=1 Tax=Neobacillus sp. MER 74 TaxID=2939566 RepID=UPI002041D466|nr:hypothetical protein [Neobacillus sp. MER 74]MCM3113795.1 hypothetical protein [Neobacillus sp. MER 74]
METINLPMISHSWWFIKYKGCVNGYVDFETLLAFVPGTKTPAGVRGRGDPAGAKRRGGSPARPRKAKCLERKPTDLFNTQPIQKI